MATEKLNAAIAVEFSLIGTTLHAMYKKDEKGYKILLIPTLQQGNTGVTVGELIADIKAMTQKVTASEVDTKELEAALNGAAAEASGADKPSVDNIRIILNMAYLYIDCEGENKNMEYAFNLNVLTEGLIPAALKDIVTVNHLGIAVWNTQRKQILDQMSIARIEDYLGLPGAEAGTTV